MYHSLVRSHNTIFFSYIFCFSLQPYQSEQFQKSSSGYLLPQAIIYENSEMRQLTSTRKILFYVVYSVLSIGAVMRINV